MMSSDADDKACDVLTLDLGHVSVEPPVDSVTKHIGVILLVVGRCGC